MKSYCGIEKLAVEKKTIDKGLKALFARAGHKLDPKKLNFHGLEALTPSKRFPITDQQRLSSEYSLSLMQALFPKGKKMPLEKVKSRFNIAAADSPFNSLMPHDRVGKVVNKMALKRNPSLAKKIDSV